MCSLSSVASALIAKARELTLAMKLGGMEVRSQASIPCSGSFEQQPS
jgi:hypothetical protein